MTNEVAIKAIQDFIGWFKEDSLIRKALEVAIQALSQEPCDDMVSRKWLLDSKRTVYITDRFDGRTSAYISKKTVEDAPSVTPKSGM